MPCFTVGLTYAKAAEHGVRGAVYTFPIRLGISPRRFIPPEASRF